MPRGNRGGRGTPRGGRGGFSTAGRGRGRGRSESFDDDFSLDPKDILPSNFRGRAAFIPRGRGRGSPYNLSAPNSGRTTPLRGSTTPRGRGRGFPRDDLGPKDRMRQKMFSTKLRSTNASLSSLLYEDRPLLKPITFVRSTLTPKLFMKEEEIFQAVVEEAGEQEASHVPTADRVLRVFSGEDAVEASRIASDDEELEEVDFEDMGKVVAHAEAMAKIKTARFDSMIATEETSTGFYIDTQPAVVEGVQPAIAVNRVGRDAPLGEPMDDGDDVVVYVAPYPKVAAGGSRRPSSALTRHQSADTLIPGCPIDVALNPIDAKERSAASVVEAAPVSTHNSDFLPVEEACAAEPPPREDAARPTEETSEDTAGPAASALFPALSAPTIADIAFSFSASPEKPKRQLAQTPRSLRKPPRVRGVARRRTARHAMFGSFGAMLSEARLQGRQDDPRREEQRRGDSDVDWGDTDGSDMDRLSSGLGGMELDGEELDLQAMKQFVKGMEAGASNHVTMGDVEDEVRMRAEDEETEEESSSEEDEEVEAVVREEERMLVAEGDAPIGEEEEEDDSDSEGDSSDEEESPRRGFQARLEKLRARSQGKSIVDMMEDGLNEDDDDLAPGFTWKEGEEELSAEVQAFLDENEAILKKHNLSHRNRLFHAVYAGQFDDDLDLSDNPGKRKDNKNKNIPPELREQWENDRLKKAERKRLRAEARLINAADPMAKKKGGKKGRKAMRAAAAHDDPSLVLPQRVVDMASLEQQIRRFLANLGGPTTLALPPMEKSARAVVHELAQTFNLKSLSKGKGAGRYTSLIKTTHSGVGVNERRVAALLRRSGAAVVVSRGGRGGPPSGSMKPREGEVIGKAAPKIGETNVGFQMLAAMGWSEGKLIGMTGGLEAPLTAVVKNTKLGLGASRDRA